MTQKELIKKLHSLRAVEPNEEFVRISRSVILSSTGIPAGGPVKQGILARGVSFALSVVLATVVLFVLVLGNTTKSFKTLFLPTLHGVNNESLISEADSITRDIDIKLEEIGYFDQARRTRTVALADDSVSLDDPEAFREGEEEIDKLLEEVIKY